MSQQKKTNDEQQIRRFKECLKFVLKWEGGYTNHPADPGGATNKGITQRVYNAYLQSKKMSPGDVRYIKDEEVEEIYYTRYYIPSHAPQLPPPLDLVVFDTAVNMGVKTSAILLQKTLQELGYYTLAIDGIIGAGTKKALEQAIKEKGMQIVVQKYIQLRNLRYHQIVSRNPKLRVFLKGWLNRTADLLRTALGVRQTK